MIRFLLLVFIFTILTSVSAQTVKVLYPNGGNSLESFTTIELLWEAVNIPFIDIAYSTDNGSSWQQIMSFYPAGQPLEWNIPGGNSDSCLLKITHSYNHSVFDLSDSLFSIYYNPSYDFIAANEVLMWVGNNGDGSHDPNNNGKGFYWPGGINNTGKTAIYHDGLVWGGKVNGEIRVNGNTHREGLRPGKILPDGSAADPSSSEYRIYKITKGWESLPPGTERDKNYYNFITWPAHLGAPWIDGNNDGVYTPGVDQPDYIGDEVLFYVANDLDSAATSYTYGSPPIGLEFQTTIYAFDEPGLDNVVFKKYILINNSRSEIYDMYLAYYVDADLGNGGDDRSATDTLNNFSYIYNAYNSDQVYGTPPPAVAHLILQSPMVPSSPSDSGYYNGQWHKGFKNVKNNAGGMLWKHYVPVSEYPGNPTQGVYEGTLEFYNIMLGLCNNGGPIIDPITGQATTYCVPGDPVTGTGWTHEAWPGGPPPMDSYYHIACGPFNMVPGDTQEVVIAIFMSQGSSNILSVAELRKDAQYYRNQYYNNFPVSVEDADNKLPGEYTLYQNYPNPFNPSTKIKFSVPAANQVSLKVYDVLGREAAVLINKEMLPGSYEVEFDGGRLSSGVYFYRIEAGGFISTKKMILIR